MLTISYIYICVVQTPSVTFTISYIRLYMCHVNAYTYVQSKHPVLHLIFLIQDCTCVMSMYIHMCSPNTQCYTYYFLYRTVHVSCQCIYICVVQTPSVTLTISYIGLYMCHVNVYTYVQSKHPVLHLLFLIQDCTSVMLVYIHICSPNTQCCTYYFLYRTVHVSCQCIYICVVQTPSVTLTISYIRLYMVFSYISLCYKYNIVEMRF